MAEKIVKDSQGLAKDLVNDCISRKTAIEKATKDHDFFRGATTPTDKARRDELLNVICWLGELPSAQPEPCVDAVSRTDVFNAVLGEERGGYVDETVECMLKVMSDLPPVTPERKKGEWINRSLSIIYPDWERYTCSACGKHAYNYDFCPNCGADMRGEQK